MAALLPCRWQSGSVKSVMAAFLPCRLSEAAHCGFGGRGACRERARCINAVVCTVPNEGHGACGRDAKPNGTLNLKMWTAMLLLVYICFHGIMLYCCCGLLVMPSQLPSSSLKLHDKVSNYELDFCQWQCISTLCYD